MKGDGRSENDLFVCVYLFCQREIKIKGNDCGTRNLYHTY